MTLSNPAQYISGRTVQEQMNSLIDYVDQRAADVALDAIASDVAQVHQDMLDADADAAAAAASAAAAAGTLANAVKKTGESSQSIAGDIAVAGDLSAGGDAGVQGQLSVLGGCDLRAPVKIPVTPTNNDDAASKKYVDDSLAGYAPMVRTTGNQSKSGVLTSLSEGGFNVTRGADYSIAFVQKNTGIQRSDTAAVRRLIPIWIIDADDNQMFSLRYEKIGTTHKVYIRVVDSTGTQHDQTLLQFTE